MSAGRTGSAGTSRAHGRPRRLIRHLVAGWGGLEVVAEMVAELVAADVDC
jgi:hypothetical protein